MSAVSDNRLLTTGVAVAGLYVVAAQLGFRVAFVAEQVTTVWAPSGIAFAALLLWGYRFWPAIWIGAFVANVGTDAPSWTAAIIATGNTLEALTGTWALRRLPRFDPTLRRVTDALAFIVIAAWLSTMVSATIGVTTLCAAAVQPWHRYPQLWSDWWLGDAIGALIVAPPIMTLVRRPPWSSGEWASAGALVAVTVIGTQLVFRQVVGPAGSHPFEYVIFPFVIAAALRGGPPVTSLVVLAASVVTIWNTARGTGPFAGPELHQSLILLQTFMGVLAGTGLLLAAAIAEREIGERRRAAAHAVGEVIATAPDLKAAAPGILRAICENLDWHSGALWVVDETAQRLRCLEVWTDSATPASAFVEMTKKTMLAPGIGLPGRVWATGQPDWIEDVVRDANFPRAPAARDAGVHGAFGAPIRLGETVVGVIECFNRAVASVDPDLLQTMWTVGNQVGQFVGRKRDETALIDEQRRTSAIVETALDAVIGMDHRGTITEFNLAATRIFGYTREQAIGRELADLLIPPSLRNRHREGLARYLATGAGPFIDQRVETTGLHAEGYEFPVEVAITRVSDAPPLFTGFVRDLTARAETEREREELLLREARARNEAETANRAKDEFLATLSHELRTPLNAIVGWTRMLLEGVLDPQSTRRALEVIDRNAHLQAQLVGDILDVSRIITGGLRLDVRPVDLATVIGAALDAVRPAADAKKVHLRSQLGASPRIVHGDPQRLQQIVWNLLSNAVKFTGAGGTVSVQLVDGGAERLHIRVLDDGAGIDREFLPHVFERFRQADGSVSRQHGGLGLGLAIVRHLVELHGGTVTAESAGAGKGSVFTVSLPSEEPAASSFSFDRRAEGGDETEVSRTLSGYRILVVEDEDDARELLVTMLKAEGAHVDTASSVADALRALDRDRPDVLLADIGMPFADGYVLIREVRRRDAEAGWRLPAAAVTAYAGDRHRERAIAEGFDAHVAKPIRRAAIVNAVLSIARPGSGITGPGSGVRSG